MQYLGCARLYKTETWVNIHHYTSLLYHHCGSGIEAAQLFGGHVFKYIYPSKVFGIVGTSDDHLRQRRETACIHSDDRSFCPPQHVQLWLWPGGWTSSCACWCNPKFEHPPEHSCWTGTHGISGPHTALQPEQPVTSNGPNCKLAQSTISANWCLSICQSYIWTINKNTFFKKFQK